MTTPVQWLEEYIRHAKLIEKNDHHYAYTITGEAGDYMTRLLTPRIGEQRLMLHRLHRADNDRHMHNHPWKLSHSIILNGGYREDRMLPASGVCSCDARGWMFECTAHVRVSERTYGTGGKNTLTDLDFHRISRVEPDTWTLFLAGARCQTWGFWVDGAVVTHDKYWGIPAGTYPAQTTQ